MDQAKPIDLLECVSMEQRDQPKTLWERLHLDSCIDTRISDAELVISDGIQRQVMRASKA